MHLHHVAASKFHLNDDAPRLFSFTIKEKEVDHMMNWSYDLVKIMYEEKLKELLRLDEPAQND